MVRWIDNNGGGFVETACVCVECLFKSDYGRSLVHIIYGIANPWHVCAYPLNDVA